MPYGITSAQSLRNFSGYFPLKFFRKSIGIVFQNSLRIQITITSAFLFNFLLQVLWKFSRHLVPKLPWEFYRQFTGNFSGFFVTVPIIIVLKIDLATPFLYSFGYYIGTHNFFENSFRNSFRTF